QRLQEAFDRGLGFVAITDHNNVVNQDDPEVLAWRDAHPDFVAIPAYENSQPGHVQMLGARSCFGNAGAVAGATIQCDRLVTDQTAEGETALADGLRAAGGGFQINHPSDLRWLSRSGYAVMPERDEVVTRGALTTPYPRRGARLFLQADSSGDGVYARIVGDETGPHAAFRVRIEGAAPGSVLRVVTDAGSVDVPLAADSSHSFRLGLGGVPAAQIFVRA